MSDISAVQSAAGMKAAQTQAQVAVELLKKTLEMQTDAMKQIMASMGLGTQVDVEA